MKIMIDCCHVWGGSENVKALGIEEKLYKYYE